MQLLLTSILIALIVVAILQVVSMTLQAVQNARRQEIDHERQELIGELATIKNVAGEVDRFKRLFENTQAKGALGELVLESVLKQFLTPGQYESQANIKKGEREKVEFAIRIPSNEDADKYVLLPVDSKFRLADYERLMANYDLDSTQDSESLKKQIEASRKALKDSILKEAKNIAKYIAPPKTTSFALMFLPNDKMFVEVLNIEGLFEEVYSRDNILIAGPSTLAAFLSSLRMGFRHIALDKRSSEILDMFLTIKKHIDDFDKVLQEVQNSLQSAQTKVSSAEKRVNAFKQTLEKIEIHVCDEPLIAGEIDVEADMPIEQ